MSKRISDLTAKGANLDATDLLEISESDGLGGYVSKSITGAEIMAAGGANLGNQDLTQTLADAVRTYDINGNILQFDNGQVVIGTAIGTDALLEVNNTTGGRGIVAASTGSIAFAAADNTGVGIEGGTDSGQAVKGYASTTGTAFLGESVSGLAALLKGGVYVETYGLGGSPQASAVFESASTTKGALIPRMTTTQMNAISSPATGLEIFNTTTGRFEHYNGTYWMGLNMRLHPIQFTSWSPFDGQTVAFGSHPIIPVPTSISPAPFEIVMRGNGVIRGCDLNTYASGVAGSNEAWSLYVRHNGTDYLVQTQSLATATRKFTNQSLNIPFVDGDIVRMIFVNPTWATNPTNVAAAGSLNIQ